MLMEKGCSFCRGDNPLTSSKMSHVGDFSAEIKGSKIIGGMITHDGGGRYDPSTREFEIYANYCIICGEKLPV